MDGTAERDETASVEMTEPGYRRIGWVKLTRRQIFTKRLQRALQSREIECPPQEVALMAVGRLVRWSFEGVMTKSPTLSTDSQHAVGGKREEYRDQKHDYIVAEWIGTGAAPDGLEFQLDRGYGVALQAVDPELDFWPAVPRWEFTMPAAGHPLEVRETERVPDPQRSGIWRVTFAVTYFGEARGTVRVDVKERGGRDAGWCAMRAAEALVFPMPSGS